VSQQSERYLLDTNVFNALLDDEIPLSAFTDRCLFVTHVQLDELKNTQDVGRREKLLACFSGIAPNQLLTSGAIWDVSKWDEAEWPEDDLLERMRPVLESLDKKKRNRAKNNNNYNQNADLLGAATAVRKQLTLVSNDCNLRTVVQQFGGRAIDTAAFGCTAEDGPS
jgi:hypothetical protein